MPQEREQKYGKHLAIDGAFVGMVLALFLLFILQAIAVFKTPASGNITLLGVIILLFLAMFKFRLYATKVQTRLIRTEFELRMAEVLDDATYKRVRGQLAINQMAGLRFASDEELPELIEAAISEKLSKNDIMKRVKNWQADWFRV